MKAYSEFKQQLPNNIKTHGLLEVELEAIKYFDDSSKNSGKQATCTIIMGGVCTGKTKLRREEYSQGYVLIDASEIFLSLCKGEYLDFPSPKFKEKLTQIGSTIANRAFHEKRNIVTEVIGADCEQLKSLIDKIASTGYKVILIPLAGDVVETWERNLKRSIDNISAYYCEPFHLKWIHDAIGNNFQQPH